MASYIDWLQGLIPLPGKYGSRFLGALGLVGNMLTQTAFEAVQGRSMGSPSFPTGALRFVGSERLMPRYPVETDDGYRARLLGAWKAWSNAGTVPAVLSQLAAAGFTAYARENHQWNWDGSTADFSRFWAVVTGHNFEPWVLGDVHSLGEDIVIGSTATFGDVVLMRSIARQWKPGHVRCSHIILVFDIDVWNADPPDGTWGDPSARCSEASYIPG